MVTTEMLKTTDQKIELHNDGSSSLRAKRKRKKQKNKHNDATCNINQNSSKKEANVESNINTSPNLGLVASEPNSIQNSSQNKKKRKRQLRKKKGNAPKTDNMSIDLQEVSSQINSASFGTEVSVDVGINSSSEIASLEAKAVSDMSMKKKKKKKKLKKRKVDAPKTDIAGTALQQVNSQTNSAPNDTEVPVDKEAREFSETVSPEAKTLSNTSPKTELVNAATAGALNDLSTKMGSVKKLSRKQKARLRKKIQKELLDASRHDNNNHIPQEEVSVNKDMLLDKDSALQPPINSCFNSQSDIKQSSSDINLLLENNERKKQSGGYKVSQTNNVAYCQMTNGKHFKKDAKFASEAANLPTVMEDLLISGRQTDSCKTATTTTMEIDIVNVEDNLVSCETSHVITVKKKKNRRKERRKPDSLGDHIDCVKANDISRTSFEHKQGACETLPEHKLDRVLEGKNTASVQCLEDIVMTEVFVNSPGAIPECKDIENRMERKDSKEDIGGNMKHVFVPFKAEVPLGQKSLDTENVKIYVQQASNAQSYSDPNSANHQEFALEIIPGLDTLHKHPSLERACISHSKKKLLVLDVNGILADIVQESSPMYKPDIRVSKKAVFKRPYCDDFLKFCFERFNVGVWSSRIKRNVERAIEFLMGDYRHRLLFCWDASQCTGTGMTTIDNKSKPLVLKELRKLWDKLEPNLPWEKGEYNVTNTLLLDDSPYKALRNPAHTGIFPYSYNYKDRKDFSLGPGGDLRLYLENLASAENIQEFVRQNPFGQQAITETSPHWAFYRQIIIKDGPSQTHDDSKTSSACQ